MKFAVFTVSTPEYDIPGTVKMLKATGYDGVEWRISSPAPAEKPADYTYERRYWSYNLSTIDQNRVAELAPEVKRHCDEAGLPVCSLTTYLDPWQENLILDTLKAARIMNCPSIRVNVPKYTEQEKYPALFERTRDQIAKRLEPLAKEYQVRINFEIHMGNIIPSASAAYRLVSSFDPAAVGIIFDPGNMVHEGFENYRLGIELLGDYLAHVHIKNAIWRFTGMTDQDVSCWKPVWAPLKQGYADLKKLLTVLRDTGYQGYLSIEDFSNEEETQTKLRNNLDFLRKISV